MLKNILCFGDSNTYGYIAGSGERYPQGVRWTSVLADLLSERYKIFEAGCNNRACFVDHQDGEKFIGKKFITKYAQYDFDIIISAIGTNDLQKVYKPTQIELEQGFEEYINVIRENFNSKIIVLAPTVIKENVLNTWFADLFDEQSVKTSKSLAEIWQRVAYKSGCYYIDLSPKISPSEIDGLHFDEISHKVIGEELAKFIYCSFDVGQ